MGKIKKIKIYTNRKRYLSVGFGAAKNRMAGWPKKIASGFFYVFYLVGYVLIKAARFFYNTVVVACFHTGSLIINSTAKTFRAAKNDILKTRENFPKRIRLVFSAQFGKSLLSFVIFAVIGAGALESLHLVAKALDIKSKIMQTALVGNNYLSQAKDELSGQDLTQAQSNFSLAYKTFSQGQQEIADSGNVLNGLLNLIPQKQDADRLIDAAGLISQAGQNFINLEQAAKTLKITAAGVTPTEQPTAQVLQNINSSLSQTESELTEAGSDIDSVDPNNLPASIKENFLDLKSKLDVAKLSLDDFNAMFNLAQNLLTGDKNVLVLFENNNELRAGGGFMGTYGDLKMENGGISNVAVSSIYDLDGQLTQVIQPPQPLLNLGPRWYLRDSNWFANFPDSAKKISDFYELEGGETPDIIVAVTPNLIIDWLKIIGPVTLPKYNLTLTADNFVEQTQAATTMSNNLPTNSPKQILADLFPLLLQKISQTGPDAFPQIVQSLQNELNNKQIVIYSRDQATEAELQAFHWTGDLSQTDRDYLSVVTSNLGGTKTDLYINQSINLASTISNDGYITDEVDITRTNTMPLLPQTNNLSYIRVYVPQGSKLISTIGFDYKNLEYPAGVNYTIDDDVYNWEKNSVTDNLTGTTIGVESGKTFFGNWLNVNGGETKTVKLVYQLPFKVNDIDRYSLLLQKQIGAQNQPINWTFNFPNYQIAWKNFDTNVLNTDNLTSDIILDKDYFLGMVLQKR